jgi:hypothetical protein
MAPTTHSAMSAQGRGGSGSGAGGRLVELRIALSEVCTAVGAIVLTASLRSAGPCHEL